MQLWSLGYDTVREAIRASGRRDGNCIRAERRLALLVIISFMYAWVRRLLCPSRLYVRRYSTRTSIPLQPSSIGGIAKRHGFFLPTCLPDLLTDCLISNPQCGERRRLVFIYAHGTRRPAHLSSCIFRFRGGLEGRGAGVPRGVEGSQLRPCASRRCMSMSIFGPPPTACKPRKTPATSHHLISLHVKRNETRLCASGRIKWQRMKSPRGKMMNGINIRAEPADSSSSRIRVSNWRASSD
ncbi:hypothetical protein L207DRAFT_188278 [Hyaloscypha variabilis F]|uniref:Uncharacterized protein n=1 Tax=Hyaloscypha variabilis (strain UAMH 11265 / GT02V1 / F) TaxID=1149755 RepID=A0A2J6QYS5_HYAVF|nr:hypothetical protein L207DRAFT_188278 [Hyaloscypha variabilis F]